MGAFLILAQIFIGSDIIALKFFKYAILGGMLGWALNKYRTANSTSSFFQNGILLGAYTSLVSGLTLVIIDFIATIISPEHSFGTFNLEVNSPMDFLAYSGALFVEIIVFGFILTFIFLQYLKLKNDDNTILE